MSRVADLWEREALSRLLEYGMRGVDPVRREVLSAATGRVLELGFGTGASLPHYGREVSELVAVEPATQLAAIGRERLQRFASERSVPASLLEASATRPLPLDAGSFDTVVILFVLCSIERLDEALAQTRRMLRPGGSVVLAEHVAAEGSSRVMRARAGVQRLVRPAWKLALGGCDPHKSLDGALERHGFDVSGLERRELGLPWVVRAGLVGRAVKR